MVGRITVCFVKLKSKWLIVLVTEQASPETKPNTKQHQYCVRLAYISGLDFAIC